MAQDTRILRPAAAQDSRVLAPSAAAAAGSTGWIRRANVDYTALSATAWTGADQGTQPTVDGVTFDIVSLSGDASVGGSGLATTDTTAIVYTRLDAGDLSGHEVIALAYAVEDVGAVQGVYFGDGFSACWALIRASTASIQAQRRTATAGYAAITYAHNQATAFLIIGTQGTTDAFYRQDAVDPSSLPAPDDAGWVHLGSANNNFLATWPIAGSDGLFIFQTAGSAGLVVDGWQVFTVREDS